MEWIEQGGQWQPKGDIKKLPPCKREAQDKTLENPSKRRGV